MNQTIGRLRQVICNSINLKQKIMEDEHLLQNIVSVCFVIIGALKKGNRIIFAGNGGSAADAQHLAAEFVTRFEFERPGLPALSLATDTSMLTAIGNDYGYDKLFLRQLQAQARSGDVFIGITTSGRSSNILTAFDGCRDLGITSIALCGKGGELEHQVDHVIRVPSLHTHRIQECHILIGHLICAEVETQLFGHLAAVSEAL